MNFEKITYNLKTRCQILFLLPAIFSFVASAQRIHPVDNFVKGNIDNSKRFFTVAEMLTYEKASKEFSGLSKVDKVDDTPALYYSKTDFWPVGAWGRGYATEVNAKQFYEAIPDKHGGYYSPHPLMRVNHRFLTAHIYDFLSGINKEENLVLIKAGVDHILSEQLADGMFIWWFRRQTQINMSSANYDDADGNLVELNKPEDYETAYALNALCEFYNSGIDYKRPEVLEAIKKSEKALLTISNFRTNTNNNIRGLGLWAIAGSYRITKNKLALTKIKDISKSIVSEQDNDGQWRTGGLDPLEYAGKMYNVHHDQKIFYQFFILRGLVEAFDVLPDKMLKNKVSKSLKSGVNHLIDKRIKPGTEGFLYAYDVIVPGDNDSISYLDSPSWYSVPEPYNSMEVFLRLYDYSHDGKYFRKSENQSLENLANMNARWIQKDMDYFRPAAMYNYYMKFKVVPVKP